jgi:hypothetical protein
MIPSKFIITIIHKPKSLKIIMLMIPNTRVKKRSAGCILQVLLIYCLEAGFFSNTQKALQQAKYQRVTPHIKASTELRSDSAKIIIMS